MSVSWRNESKACTEGDTGVSKSFLSLLFESNRSFFSSLLLFLFASSSVFVNPNESDSLEVTLPLQAPLMAYGDG